MSIATQAAAGSPELSRRRRLAVLTICCFSLLLVGLDATIVNVALPSIHRALHAKLDGLQWTIDAYTLVLASLLVLSGSTADRVGRRRVFQIGLATFTLGSALCAAAPNLGLLIGARALQAIGGSMLNPVALSIVRNVFTDPRERVQALGIWSAMIGVATALGPVVGGALVDGPGWRFVFLINVPVGIAALVLTRIFVPESRAPRARRLDPVGQVLVIVGLATLVYAIIEGQSHGWGSTEIVTLFAIALVAFVTLVLYELRREQPLLEMRFFRSAPFSGASMIAVAAFASLSGFLFLNTLYLQSARGLSAFDAGLMLLPTAAMMILTAPISGRIVGASGTRVPLVAAGVALTAAPLMLTGITTHTSVVYLLCAYGLLGAGLGMVNPPISNTAISGMPAAQAGTAAAIASTSRQIGNTLGVAVLGAVAGAGAGQAFGPAFAGATHPGWFILAGLGVVVLVVGAVTTTSWADRTARATAERLEPESVAAG
jgi:EmrB/QacA subfamily drug resistance transporter